MGELTIVTLCQTLSNLTNNRCFLVDNSNTCRCVGGDLLNPTSPPTNVIAAPDIMSSEIFLICFVLAIWLSAIGFCLNQYKSLRRLETQVHYCVNRKDPLNIGDIKIVTREQDSIIYKKKRYSTLTDTQMTQEELKSMQYVQQYLPKTTLNTVPSTLSTIAMNQDDLTDTIASSTAVALKSTMNILSNLRQDSCECQPSVSYFKNDLETNRRIERISQMYPTSSVHYSAGLTVPYISTPSSLRSSWNDSRLYDANPAQHLCVPSNRRRSNRLSDGNISLPVPQMNQIYTENHHEQLLDPRLIPETVRRSLLALHRESQENINSLKKKEKTRSENDVHGAFSAWKVKMKSKLKRTHHQQQTRSHSNTLLLSPTRTNTNDHDPNTSEHIITHNESQFSSPTADRRGILTGPLVRRNLKHYPQYTTQSTTESETMPEELPVTTSIYISIDNEESADTIVDTNENST